MTPTMQSIESNIEFIIPFLHTDAVAALLRVSPTIRRKVKASTCVINNFLIEKLGVLIPEIRGQFLVREKEEIPSSIIGRRDSIIRVTSLQSVLKFVQNNEEIVPLTVHSFSSESPIFKLTEDMLVIDLDFMVCGSELIYDILNILQKISKGKLKIVIKCKLPNVKSASLNRFNTVTVVYREDIRNDFLSVVAIASRMSEILTVDWQENLSNTVRLFLYVNATYFGVKTMNILMKIGISSHTEMLPISWTSHFKLISGDIAPVSQVQKEVIELIMDRQTRQHWKITDINKWSDHKLYSVVDRINNMI